MVRIEKKNQESKILDLPSLTDLLGKNVRIKKYDSIEMANDVFLELLNNFNSEYQNFLLNQLKSDLPVDELEILIKNISNINTFSTLIKVDDFFKINNVSPETITKIYMLYKDFKSLVDDNIGENRDYIKNKLIQLFNKKITFSIKDTREELGYKNQRTFKKWLVHFYGNKFENRRTIYLLEYIDIIKKFILMPSENDLDIKNNRLEYQNRLKNGLIYSKAKLKKFTNDDYKLLQIELEELNDSNKIKIPSDVDFIPFSIAQLIIQHLE